MTNYNYDDARLYCKGLGIEFIEEWIIEPDKRFAALELTQYQVDVLMREHIWHVSALFSPGDYSIMDRIKMALYFLLSNKKIGE